MSSSSSILTSFGQVGRSSDVEMHLVIGDQTISVGQIGPEYVILDAAFDHPPTPARLFFSIDGNAREREIFLPEGISANSRRVVIAAVK